MSQHLPRQGVVATPLVMCILDALDVLEDCFIHNYQRRMKYTIQYCDQNCSNELEQDVPPVRDVFV